MSRNIESTEEISSLIQTLIATGARLEELTDNQVDSVAGPDGKAFLLGNAQHQLRAVESSRQAAILNALPANVALIDNQGIIISVNEAWREFATANSIHSLQSRVNLHTYCDPDESVGMNYLTVCEDAVSSGSVGSGCVASGIRSVLSGEAKSFSIEYPCHAPAEMRWFLMIVTPVMSEVDHAHGAVIMHLNITERHRSTQTLNRTLQRLHEAQSIGRIGDWEFELGAEEISWSPQVFAITGRDPAMGSSTHAEQAQYFAEDSLALLKEKIALAISSGERQACEMVVLRPDGEHVHVQTCVIPRRDEVGRIVGMYGTVQDITESRKTNLRIKYLNRVYAMLSKINMLILRVRSSNELFRQASQIAVEAGGFSMALIGIVDPSMQALNQFITAGKDEKLLDAIEQVIASPETCSKTMIARALQEKKVVVSNDSQNDPQVLLGKAYSDAGIRSQAVLPLIVANEAIGVIALYSSEVGAFHEEEMKLLKELAGDIAFAKDYIDKQARADYLAYYDALTGLANRALFIERVSQYVRTAVDCRHKLAVLLINLERFKNLNDSLGRPAGDKLLTLVAEWLTRENGDVNLLARIGSDLFAVVLPDIKSGASLDRRLGRAMKAFMGYPFSLAGKDYRIAARIGVALFPDDGADADSLFRNAEAALKQAKTRGVRCLFHTQEMTSSIASALTLENQLRRALEQNEFVLHYQPKISLKTGKITSAEALIRWNDPRTGVVLPGLFIRLLEETGLIHEVGRWVLAKAAEDYLRWCDSGMTPVPIAVNVSSVQLRDSSFIAELAQAVSTDARMAAGLELEITESVIMADLNINSLQAIRDMGISIAIDDFGTGFSSLSYLAKLPVDILKIDRSFIIEMSSGPEGMALVSTIISLGHSLNMKVVAEGVETEEQMQLLKSLRCDEIQGFVISKALPVELFEAKYLLR